MIAPVAITTITMCFTDVGDIAGKASFDSPTLSLLRLIILESVSGARVIVKVFPALARQTKNANTIISRIFRIFFYF